MPDLREDAAKYAQVNLYSLLPPLGTACPPAGYLKAIPHTEAKHPFMAVEITNRTTLGGFFLPAVLGSHGRLAISIRGIYGSQEQTGLSDIPLYQAVWDWKEGVCLDGIPVPPKLGDHTPSNRDNDDDGPTCPNRFFPMGPFAISAGVFQICPEISSISSEAPPAPQPHFTTYALSPTSAGIPPSSYSSSTVNDQSQAYNHSRAIWQPTDIPWVAPLARFTLPQVADLELASGGAVVPVSRPPNFSLNTLDFPYSEEVHNGDISGLVGFDFGNHQSHILRINTILKLSTEALVDNARRALEETTINTPAPHAKHAKAADIAGLVQGLPKLASMSRVEQTRWAAEALACLNEGKVRDIGSSWEDFAKSVLAAGSIDDESKRYYWSSTIVGARELHSQLQIGDNIGLVLVLHDYHDTTETVPNESLPMGKRKIAKQLLTVQDSEETAWKVLIGVENDRGCHNYLTEDCDERGDPSGLAWMPHRSTVATLSVWSHDGPSYFAGVGGFPPGMMFDGVSVVLQGVIPDSLMFITFEG
ncbi:hypothetical protein L202_00943 [Cryptococcus amylolentus CBS 6039]|uniref:Uncharacterized protein n=1 Tax=Cryptococcus amylolentus CBS 6039 TaxID=1295533 RepID=A0A1E3I2S0_9TREE|nr:hypothetical protein L202_00943 [Cryptococcus amylolentus CBS 6039]ODN82645.1 hypothetical protein L202_00943 [Cryptococcus amylolentus CBS 6039]